MTLKNFLNWFKFSGVWGGVVVNPYHWEPDFKFYTKTDDEQWGLFFLELNLGIAWIRIIVDDGRW
jgi:hypothetical protein